MKKRNKGITLIALIITIIVMLILVAVSVNIAISGGLFGTAKKAVRKTDVAKLQEEWMMTKYADYNTTTGRTNVPDGPLSDVFGDKYEQYNDQFAIENGELVYIGTDETMKQYATELGIVAYAPLWNEAKGCNAPKLMTGMTPIKISADGTVSTTKADDTTWYNYTNKEWANAKTEDGSMWVWIPRFAYKINAENYHKSTAGTIDITFLKNRRTTAEGKTIVNASGAGNWNIHPAFKFGDKELEGIWVAKFEASPSEETFKIIPGVASYRNINVNDIFTKCKKYKPELNSHMMKNSEWGAVAYLTHSQYGQNTTEVTINNNSSYITGGGTDKAYATTNTAQSTTGNVTGIYDMSGGALEFVAAYVNNGHDNLTTNYGKSLYEADAKYKDVYEVGSSDGYAENYTKNSTVYGDAVYETSTPGYGSNSWFSDYSFFPNSYIPFLKRGGKCDGGSCSGLFNFDDGTGNALDYAGFRPVLVEI